MSVGQEKLKTRCIQLAKKAIEEAFPNTLTFTTHFTIKTSNAVFAFSLLYIYLYSHYYYFYLAFSTSTSSVLPLPSPILPPTLLLPPLSLVILNCLCVEHQTLSMIISITALVKATIRKCKLLSSGHMAICWGGGGGGGGGKDRFRSSQQLRILVSIAGEPQKLDEQKYISVKLSFHKFFQKYNF